MFHGGGGLHIVFILINCIIIRKATKNMLATWPPGIH